MSRLTAWISLREGIPVRPCKWCCFWPWACGRRPVWGCKLHGPTTHEYQPNSKTSSSEIKKPSSSQKQKLNKIISVSLCSSIVCVLPAALLSSFSFSNYPVQLRHSQILEINEVTSSVLLSTETSPTTKYTSLNSKIFTCTGVESRTRSITEPPITNRLFAAALLSSIMKALSSC